MKATLIKIGLSAVAVGLVVGPGWLADRGSEGRAIAAVGEGFAPSEYFPEYGTQWDGYAHPSVGIGIDEATFTRLYSHVAFPQSRGAMVSLLGWPDEMSGNYDIYSRAGHGDKVAVYYVGDTATFFTAGY